MKVLILFLVLVFIGVFVIKKQENEIFSDYKTKLGKQERDTKIKSARIRKLINILINEKKAEINDYARHEKITPLEACEILNKDKYLCDEFYGG
jgi:hypothetical protein